MNGEYCSFEQLASCHLEGADFDRVIVDRNDTKVVLLAPHGGRIEPYTDEIAAAIAGGEFSLYCFRSRVAKRVANLHITSHNFDDPDCLSLVAKHSWAVAIHGCSIRGSRVFVGGRDTLLVDELVTSLSAAGIRAELQDHPYRGLHPRNVCNRTATGVGAQFELTLEFRRGKAVGSFVVAVRAVLLQRQSAA